MRKSYTFMVNNTELIILLLMLIFCVQSSQLNTTKYDFLNQTRKHYCFQNVLTQSDVKRNKEMFHERASQMSQWLPDFSSHLVGAIINLCNRRYQQIQIFLYNLCKYTLIYFMPFSLAFILIIILLVAWIYSVFWKTHRKATGIQIGYQFTNKTQVALAVFIISILITLSISSYGLNNSDKIQKSLNTFWCSLFNQHHGYLRNQINQKSRMVDFAAQINKVTQFMTEKYAKIQSLFTSIQKTKIFQPTNISSNQAINANISGLFTDLSNSLIYFNDTLEFERQVMIGATFVIGNLDRYGNKYIGYDNISKIFSKGVEYILLAVIAICLFSGCMVGFILIKSKAGLMYFKHIIQYLLGFICFVCLASAFFNSLISVFLHNLNLTLSYQQIGENPREQFLASKTLNDPIVEIMVSFWPQSSGNITHYGKGMFLNTLTTFEQQINSYNKIFLTSIGKDENKNSSQLSKQNESQNYQHLFELIQVQLRALRQNLTNPELIGGRLDPTALGRYIYNFGRMLIFNIFDTAYEYRIIFGYVSFFLLVNIISSIFINISYKTYSKASQFDQEHESSLQMQQKHRKGSNQFFQLSSDH